MKKQILSTLGVATLGLVTYATTFMRVELFDGSIVKFAVDDVRQVDYVDESTSTDTIPVLPTDTVPVLPLDTTIKDTTVKCEYVDLGLPSGILWATFNIGATAPEGYGDYFAWGETVAKDSFYWGNYKYATVDANGKADSLLKYNLGGYPGIVDSLTTLKAEDDAATANWGAGWRTPTANEWKELMKSCFASEKYVNGVRGKLLTSRINGNAIFLPFAGYRHNGKLENKGDYSYHWSSTLNDSLQNLAYRQYCNAITASVASVDRYFGFTVRPVFDTTRVVAPSDTTVVLPADTTIKDTVVVIPVDTTIKDTVVVVPVDTTIKDTVVVVPVDTTIKDTVVVIPVDTTIKDTVVVIPVDTTIKDTVVVVPVDTTIKDTVVVVPVDTTIKDTTVKYEYVDLGLSSGILWATTNIGATAPEGYGDYFAWGETVAKKSFYWNNYKYATVDANGKVDSLLMYNSGEYPGIVDSLTTLKTEDDAATANWGAGWRTPTVGEWEELMNSCVASEEYVNGVRGKLLTSKINGNTIFLPFAGYRYNEKLEKKGDYSYHWSSTLNVSQPNTAYRQYCNAITASMAGVDRCYGFTIRPVYEKK